MRRDVFIRAVPVEMNQRRKELGLTWLEVLVLGIEAAERVRKSSKRKEAEKNAK